MKKLSLAVIGMYAAILSAFSQNNNSDTSYKLRKLKVEEVNFVSSYYQQDGNHAAVTGGTGSEKLTDLSNSIDLNLYGYDRKYRKHTLTFEAGFDHYTSASSDQIDPHTLSSASHSDTRIYPSFDWKMENEKKGTTFGAGVSYSTEFDYQSIGANVNFAKKTKDKSGEFSTALRAYFDQVSLIYPIELRTSGGGDDGNDYASASRNSFSGSLSWSQIVNQNLQLWVDGELIYQDGFLSLPFHRVYFTDGSMHVESLPSSRLKIPLGLRANYFIGDKFILRTWYRNYHDDWGINSNAMQVETVVKFTPFFSVTPFFRFYQQTASKYFAPFETHTANNEFFTSNYDLSKFNSNFFGVGFRTAPPKGVLNLQHISALELRYGHYAKNNGMNANIISLNLKLK